MPSFDIVSELDKHELSNAVDQANKEVIARFDFKGTDSSFKLDDNVVTMISESEFQLKQMYDILTQKMLKRSIDTRCAELKDADIQAKTARQQVMMREGLDKELAKKIVKIIKDAKFKVQTQVQGEMVRVTGKKRDDLQTVIQFLKGNDSIELPLQFNNFRD